jgi:hypothetical protein
MAPGSPPVWSWSRPGPADPLRWPPRGAHAEQTAVGIVLGTTDAERLVPDAGDTALFMDWRPPA